MDAQAGSGKGEDIRGGQDLVLVADEASVAKQSLSHAWAEKEHIRVRETFGNCYEGELTAG